MTDLLLENENARRLVKTLGLPIPVPEKLARALRSHLRRARPLALPRCKALRLVAEPGETEGDFRVRVQQALREKRDEALDKLEKRWAPRLARAEKRVRTRAQAVERQREQRSGAAVSAVISVGATVLGALFGRRVGTGTVGRAASAAARRGSRKSTGRSSTRPLLATRSASRTVASRFRRSTARTCSSSSAVSTTTCSVVSLPAAACSWTAAAPTPAAWPTARPSGS